MSKAQRYRSRLFPRELDLGHGDSFNAFAHNEAHGRKHFVWTSKATLDTNANTPWSPPFGGRLVGVTLNVTGAGASDLTLDVKLDGTSLFPSNPKPKIVAGQTLGSSVGLPDIINFSPASVFVCQLTATGACTGPLVATFAYLAGEI